MSDSLDGATKSAAPGMARRLACFLYEGILLFAVAMAVGLIYSPLARQHHALEHRAGLMLALAAGFGAYFIYFWTRGGQTLAMKTWHIRLLRSDGLPLSLAHASLRYLLSFLWWALPIASAIQLRAHGLGFGAVAAVGLLGLLAYAMLAKVLPGGQFLHDVICRTMLVTQHPKKKTGSAATEA